MKSPFFLSRRVLEPHFLPYDSIFYSLQDGENGLSPSLILLPLEGFKKSKYGIRAIFRAL